MYNKEELDEIIDALYYCNFNDLEDEEFRYQVINPFAEKYHKSFDWNTGASKGVLIFKNLGLVIKIPFEGFTRYDEDDESYEFEYFCGANNKGCEWDYCLTEAKLFKSACEYGLEDYFAKTEKIAEIDCHPIYIQPFVDILEYTDSHHSEEEKEEVRSLFDNKDFHKLNIDWLVDVLYYFGEKGLVKLLNFIKEFQIGDLHDGNVGYIGQRPVLVDYSDYND